MHVKERGQLCGVSTFLYLMGPWGLNSGSEAFVVGAGETGEFFPLVEEEQEDVKETEELCTWSNSASSLVISESAWGTASFSDGS